MQTHWPKWMYAVITEAGGYYREEEDGYTFDFQLEDGTWSHIYVMIDEERHECSVTFDNHRKWGGNDAYRFLEVFEKTLTSEGVSFFLFVEGLDESIWSDEEYEKIERFLDEEGYPYRGIAFGEKARAAKSLINGVDRIRMSYESTNHILLDAKLYGRAIGLKANACTGKAELWTAIRDYYSTKLVDKVAEIGSKEEVERLIKEGEEAFLEVKEECGKHGFSCVGVTFQGLCLYDVKTEYGAVLLSRADEVAALHQRIEKEKQKLETAKEEISSFIQTTHPYFQFGQKFFAFGEDHQLNIRVRYPGGIYCDFLGWHTPFGTPEELKEGVISEWKAHLSLQEKLGQIPSLPYVEWDPVRRAVTEKEDADVPRPLKIIKAYGVDQYQISSDYFRRSLDTLNNQELVVEVVASLLQVANDRVADMVEIRDRLYQENPGFVGSIGSGGNSIRFAVYGKSYTLFRHENEAKVYKIDSKVLQTTDEAIDCILAIYRMQSLREELKERKEWPSSPYIYRFASEHQLMLHSATWEGDEREICRRLDAYYEQRPPYKKPCYDTGETCAGLTIKAAEGGLHRWIVTLT